MGFQLVLEAVYVISCICRFAFSTVTYCIYVVVKNYPRNLLLALSKYQIPGTATGPVLEHNTTNKLWQISATNTR